MSNGSVPVGGGETRSTRALKSSGRGLSNFFGGLAILFVLWWIGGLLIAANPLSPVIETFRFAYLGSGTLSAFG